MGASAPQPRRAWTMLGGDAVKALLAAPQCAKTTHFVLHRAEDPVAPDLPTEVAPPGTESVDISTLPALPLAVAFVVPKRHARRAVTRNLVRRQMREALGRHSAGWQGGVLIRLRGAFAPAAFRSAASIGLRDAVRHELELLFQRAAARP